jgi:hypothetical protein
MLIGATGCTANNCLYKGSTLVIHGPADPTRPFATKVATITGEDPYDYFGWSLDGDFDSDGDGSPDILASSYYASDETTGEQYNGATYLFYGPVEGGVSAGAADFRINGANAYDYSGYHVAAIGDHDGDGLVDLAMGIPATLSSTGYGYAGAVSIFNSTGL